MSCRLIVSSLTIKTPGYFYVCWSKIASSLEDSWPRWIRALENFYSLHTIRWINAYLVSNHTDHIFQKPIFHISIGSVPFSSFPYPLDRSAHEISLGDVSNDASDDDISETIPNPFSTSLRQTAEVVECNLGHRVFQFSLRGTGLQSKESHSKRKFVEVMR